MTDGFLYFEGLSIGQKFKTSSITVTEEDIIAYARQFDPQFFHTDPEAAKHSIFGGLVASGWHTSSLTMRMMTDSIPPMKGGMIGRAIEKISWPRAVRPGDTLTLHIEVLEKRELEKTPERGLFRTKNTVLNQKGEPVMEMEALVFAPRKSS